MPDSKMLESLGEVYRTHAALVARNEELLARIRECERLVAERFEIQDKQTIQIWNLQRKITKCVDIMRLRSKK